MNNSNRSLTRDQVLQLLTEVGELLRERHIEGVIYIVGGSAMSLAFDSRRVTRDVDAAIRSEHDGVQEAAGIVAERHGLDPNWLNSRAAAFMTHEPDDGGLEINLPGLRITVASPEHLIAMKLRAMRDRDIEDLDALFRIAGITDPQQAADIHNRLFDESYMGYFDPAEALYAAQIIFDRAELRGRPIGPLSGDAAESSAPRRDNQPS